MLQFVGGLGPMLPKYPKSYSPGLLNPVMLYSPLIATSPGRHDTVELAWLFVIAVIVEEFLALFLPID